MSLLSGFVNFILRNFLRSTRFFLTNSDFTSTAAQLALINSIQGCHFRNAIVFVVLI